MAKRIKKEKLSEKKIADIYADYLTAQAARDLSESTIRNYKTHFKGISKHLDTEMAFGRLTKRNLEEMVVSMKESDLAHNSISTYVRAMNQFLKWCAEEGL